MKGTIKLDVAGSLTPTRAYPKTCCDPENWGGGRTRYIGPYRARRAVGADDAH